MDEIVNDEPVGPGKLVVDMYAALPPWLATLILVAVLVLVLSLICVIAATSRLRGGVHPYSASTGRYQRASGARPRPKP